MNVLDLHEVKHRSARSRGYMIAGITVLAVGLWHASAWATEQSDTAVEIGKGVPTVAALFMTSPIINFTLLGMSVLALLMFVYLLMSVSNTSFIPPEFIDNVTRLVINRKFEQAVNLCQNNSHRFASSVVQRCIENHDKDQGVLMDIVHAEGHRRAEVIWNRIGYLAEISNIAPMLGLLGTMIGMVKVFFTLDTRTAGLKALMLSQGIAEAMGTTLFGLVVAIAAGVFYTVVKSRATVVLANTEKACHTVADHTHRAHRNAPDSSRH